VGGAVVVDHKNKRERQNRYEQREREEREIKIFFVRVQ